VTTILGADQSDGPEIPPANINGVVISDFNSEKIAFTFITGHSPCIVRNNLKDCSSAPMEPLVIWICLVRNIDSNLVSNIETSHI